jgi:signal transduction histidine kinase
MSTLNLYFRTFDFIAKKRIDHADLDPRRVHTHLVVVLSTGMIMWGYAFLAYLTITSPVPGIVGFVCATVHILSPFLFRLTKSAFLTTNVMVASGMIHQGVFGFYTGGFESSILVWFGILPMLAGIIAGRNAAILWGIITTVCALIFLYLHIGGFQFPDLITESGQLVAQALHIFGWIFLSTSIVYVMLTLNEAKEKILVEQAKKIEDLFRVLFHDLAGPLSRITIGMEISKNVSDVAIKERGLNIAEKAAESMIEITKNVREMYAMSKGKTGSHLTFFPLTSAVEYVKKIYSPDLEKKNITLDFDHKRHEDLNFWVDPISFKNQVLGNILSNAIKFSPLSGTISIRAYAHNQQFHIIEISDQGIGMPETLIGELFDVTKKTSRPGTLGETGTGFGMHIMKSFIEMYGGEVKIVSQEKPQKDHGTTIKLYLKAELNRRGSPLPE